MMVCTSVAVAAVVVKQNHLQKLLNEQKEALAELAKAYFAVQYPSEQIKAVVVWNGVRLSIGYREFLLRDGKVEDLDRYDDEYFEQVKKFLPIAAEKLFADQVAAMLLEGGKLTDRQYAEVVTSTGEVTWANILYATYEGFRFRVITLPGGRTEVMVDEGTFDQAKTITLEMIGELEAAGVEIAEKSEVEQHRAGGMPHAHMAAHQH